jgi:hypothetical protein
LDFGGAINPSKRPPEPVPFWPRYSARVASAWETRKLEDVNEAFDEVDSGKVKARLVFDLR